MAIWWHLGRRKGDFGQVWLALSVLCWSMAGIAHIYFGENSNSKYLADGWQSIISIFNSLFILLALPYFQYIPERLKALIKSNYWLLIIGIPFLFSLLPTLSRMMGYGLGPIRELDVYFSLMTLIFLGITLWESFDKRNLRLLAILSVSTIMVTLFAQFSKLDFLLPTALSSNLLLLSSIFKTMLIMIFFALALSWVKEEKQKRFVSFRNMSMQLNRKTKVVSFGGPNENDQKSIKLNQTRFDLLERLIEARMKDNSWLRIKPKDQRSNTAFDISDHNQIRRLCDSLLDCLYGTNMWKLSEEAEAFKADFFEKDTGKIRLRLSANQLSFENQEKLVV